MESLNSREIEAAELLSVRALGFLAGDTERLGRFLALTGLGPETIRAEAHSPHVQAAVLQHFLQDETLLLVFAAETGIAADTIAPAFELLSKAEQ